MDDETTRIFNQVQLAERWHVSPRLVATWKKMGLIVPIPGTNSKFLGQEVIRFENARKRERTK